MSFEDDVRSALDIPPLGEEKSRGRQPTTRLDYTGTKRQPTGGISKSKLVQSGNMMEVYDFQIPVSYGQKRPNKRKIRKSPTRSDEHRARSIIRAINNVRRLTHANFSEHDKFITLTFNNDQHFDINKLNECLPYYQRFIRKIRNRFPNLKFITVPEFQKRGAVHYHILCNLPFMPMTSNLIEKFWTHGFSNKVAIKSTTHLSLYLTKYLSKRFDDKRIQGHRLYYTSRGLARPKTIYGPLAESFSDKLKSSGVEVQYRHEYQTDRNGQVEYRQYLGHKK